MSDEQNKERTVEDIQREYSNLCTRVGHAQYQIFTLQKDIEIMNDQLRDLNLEAASVAAKQAAKAAEEKKDAQA